MDPSWCLQTTVMFDDECTTLSSKIAVYGEMQPLIRTYCVCWTVSWISAKCVNKLVTQISLPPGKDNLMPPLCLPPFWIYQWRHACVYARWKVFMNCTVIVISPHTQSKRVLSAWLNFNSVSENNRTGKHQSDFEREHVVGVLCIICVAVGGTA